MRQTDSSQQYATSSSQPHVAVEPVYSSPAPRPSRQPSHLRRFRFLYLGIIAAILLVLALPLINLSRYQRRIAASISDSLGRPVHLDNISLMLLPVPGLTIQNLVVGESPEFGSEPIIRANSVHATLRLASLWRRQVEISSISFTDPSVNLVHSPNGRWNIEGILLSASRVETAPTAQPHAGPAPRFPYIEATGARLNIKQGQEKLSFSLVDADFALWLPDPHQWHLRLSAHPTRTDANVNNAGTIEIESTLGAASSLAQVPFNLQGQWRDAPLGEATHVLFGHDAGWRGVMNLAVNLRGTFGENAVTARLHLEDTRPADFVPDQSLTTDAECFATASGLFHAFEDIRCSWPPASAAHNTALTLTGAIPDVHRLEAASFQLSASELPASRLVTLMRATSPRVPSDLTAAGALTGTLTYSPAAGKNAQHTAARWQGQFTLAEAKLSNDGDKASTLLSTDVHLHTASNEPPTRHRNAAPSPAAHGLLLPPTPLLLGGRDPATLEGRFDSTGYILRLSGNATASRLESLAQALPPLGDGLLKAPPQDYPTTAPFHLDLTATRTWHGQQIWAISPEQSPKATKPHIRRR
ncbi:MAG TPA: AsmA family protein [Edaphobacter sp.]